MELVGEREDRETRLRAALHGVKLADRGGHVAGLRQGHMARMKARRRGGR